jgi:hypothetical protein
MTQEDQKILFNSLGFLAVLLRGESDQQDNAKRARGLAWLIEEFCRTVDQKGFAQENDLSDDPLSDARLEDWIKQFKTKLQIEGEAMLPEDRASLLRIHKLLEDRANQKARQNLPTELLADLILQMIDNEIEEERISQ